MKPRSAIKTDLFAFDHHRKKIDTLGDPLAEIESHIDFVALAAVVDQIAPRPVSAQGGRPPYPTETMVRILVLKRLYNLSDEQMEYQLLDRMSYQRFCGLANATNIPDRTTVWTFENRIGEAGAKALFDGVSAQLLKKGFIARGGQIIDATLVSAPKQHNSRGEKALIEQGAMPAGWKPAKRRQKDRVRGLLAEFGLIVDPGPKHLRALLAEREFDTALSPALRGVIQSVRDQLEALDTRIGECDRQITAQQADDPLAKRARDLPGVGLITADAVTASVGDASMFRNGRQFAAWLGLTPSQSGSGGKTRLGRITRRGDDYLRTLLVQGARSVLAATLRKQRRESPEKLTRLQQWIVVLNGRIGYHKTLIAIANKHARQLWAVLAKGEAYNPQAWQRA